MKKKKHPFHKHPMSQIKTSSESSHKPLATWCTPRANVLAPAPSLPVPQTPLECDSTNHADETS